jgi:hypothetical protein
MVVPAAASALRAEWPRRRILIFMVNGLLGKTGQDEARRDCLSSLFLFQIFGVVLRDHGRGLGQMAWRVFRAVAGRAVTPCSGLTVAAFTAVVGQLWPNEGWPLRREFRVLHCFHAAKEMGAYPMRVCRAQTHPREGRGDGD